MPGAATCRAVHQKPAQCSAERRSETRSDKARQAEMVLSVCEAQLQHIGKSWPDLLEIGIISSAALVAEQAGGPEGSRRKRQDANISLKQIKYQKAAGSFETAWLLFWQRRKASH